LGLPWECDRVRECDFERDFECDFERVAVPVLVGDCDGSTLALADADPDALADAVRPSG